MPGITGIIGPSVQGASEYMLRQMVAVMRREPFYSSGTYQNESCRTGIGWVVHRGGFADCNPVWNETRDICLVFTGEEFAERSDIQALWAGGHKFNSNDCSYLVHWYEELGPAFVERLNGVFAGVIFDLRQDKIILFNDRYGLCRIYYHERAGEVYFSSEAKSLLRVLHSVRQIDATSLAEFSSCGCVLQNRTLFAGVSLLPPASRWTFSRGRLDQKEIYFKKETWEQLPGLGETEFYEKLNETFPRIVAKYFSSTAPVAMSLTGGLDGRMIMACSGHIPGTLPCYTFVGPYRECMDVTLARQVAHRCGQEHQVIRVDEKFIEQFPALADESVYISDGAMDVTGSLELFVNRQAREIAPVRMTGNYGSEILRRNIAFKAQPLNPSVFSTEFLRLSTDVMATYEQESQGNQLSFIVRKQVPWHHHSRLSIEQSQLTIRSPYLDNELVALAYQAPQGLERSTTAALRFIGERNQSLGHIPTDRGLVYLPTPVLSKLNNLYQEFTFRAEYAYDYGMPQWLARLDNAFRPLRLERAFLGRHKFGHFRVWYRDKLGAYLKEVLLDTKTKSRPHVAGERLETLVKEHLSGRRNHTLELHQVLSIELIHRQLIDRN